MAGMQFVHWITRSISSYYKIKWKIIGPKAGSCNVSILTQLVPQITDRWQVGRALCKSMEQIFRKASSFSPSQDIPYFMKLYSEEHATYSHRNISIVYGRWNHEKYNRTTDESMPIDRKNMIFWNKALLLSEHVVEVTVSMAKGIIYYIRLISLDDRTFDHIVLLSVAIATDITSDEEQ
jgi:hypothetical protein